MDIQPTTTSETVTADRPWLLSLHGSSTNKTITLDLTKFTETVHWVEGTAFQPMRRLKSGLPLGKVTASGLYAPYAGATNEVQTVTITGSPTGGTFTLTWSGQTTAAIAYNATAATVRTALEALSNIAPGDVTVTGSAGGPYTVTFGGANLGDDVAQMTASGASLTGGSSPAVSVATTTGGGAAGASDGTQVFAGLLYTETAFNPGSTKCGAALMVHGDVRMDKLPLPFERPASTGRTDSINFS
ncbi:hypothetical protein [Streptomyces platensis]|uniref:hypothetical protein n=1 Tax=Streptomyces platensis TaxID=58346 RepID=UPI003324EC03